MTKHSIRIQLSQVKRASKRTGATATISIPDDLAYLLIRQVMFDSNIPGGERRVKNLELHWTEP